jgi:integrase
MPVVTLTARNVGSLSGGPGQRVDFHDASVPGFMLRVSGGNGRTYAVWYRVNGQARRFTIGSIDVISLADARERARQILADARAGIDAMAERKAAQVEAHKARLLADSLDDLSRRFLASHGSSLAPRTLAEYRRTLVVDVLPELGGLPPKEITRAMVRALLDTIRKRAPTQANRTLATLRKLFSWAVEHEIVEVSPCLGIKAPTEEKPRVRVYTNDEIRALIAGVAGTEIAQLVPFIFYTATRSEEARSARWCDMDLERRLWVIPDTKEGQAHAVPLSDGAMRVLAGLPRVSDYVFPAGTVAGYMDHPQKAVLAVRVRSGVADFRLHDVRRTVRTRLAELGVTPDVAERVLGHVIAGIRRVYDRYDYVPQMRAALDVWGTEFERILQAIPLSPRGKA